MGAPGAAHSFLLWAKIGSGARAPHLGPRPGARARGSLQRREPDAHRNVESVENRPRPTWPTRASKPGSPRLSPGLARATGFWRMWRMSTHNCHVGGCLPAVSDARGAPSRGWRTWAAPPLRLVHVSEHVERHRAGVETTTVPSWHVLLCSGIETASLHERRAAVARTAPPRARAHGSHPKALFASADWD